MDAIQGNRRIVARQAKIGRLSDYSGKAPATRYAFLSLILKVLDETPRAARYSATNALVVDLANTELMHFISRAYRNALISAPRYQKYALH